MPTTVDIYRILSQMNIEPLSQEEKKSLEAKKEEYSKKRAGNKEIPSIDRIPSAKYFHDKCGLIASIHLKIRHPEDGCNNVIYCLYCEKEFLSF